MEVDYDVYKNLEPEEPSLCEQIDNLQQENHQFQAHIASLECDVEKLCAKIVEMKKVQDNLTRNISELYKTAKAELDRKDRTIAELRSQLDNMVFRRNNRCNTQPSISSDPVKRSRENSPNLYKSTNDFNPKRPKRDYGNPEWEKIPSLHKSDDYNIQRPMKDHKYRESSPSSYKSNNDYNSRRAKREYDDPSRENSPSLCKTSGDYNVKRSMKNREYSNQESSPSFHKWNSDFNARKHGHDNFRSKSPPGRRSGSSGEYKRSNVEERSKDKNRAENSSDISYGSYKKQPLIR